MMMADDATREELWRRLGEESPHTSDDEIERLFIAVAKDNEDRIRQIMEWGFR
jgi:GTPase Era involved in 16S rRNA processing